MAPSTKRLDCKICVKKSAAVAALFLWVHMSNLDYSFHHYNFCEVGSGVTIVSTGSGVGAEHAATVNASTKPTTIFFILYPFTDVFSAYALIKA